MKTISQNKKAFFDYFIEEKFEAGISLIGTEVKSVRNARVNIKESYIDIVNGEMFINGMHISPYEMGSYSNTDPLRKRKLLMHRREIMKLANYVSRDGYTLVPTQIYFNERGLIKIEIGLAKGKKNYDKRESIAKKESDRRIEQHLKNKDRY
jgi:SsrA-binding protein